MPIGLLKAIQGHPRRPSDSESHQGHLEPPTVTNIHQGTTRVLHGHLLLPGLIQPTQSHQGPLASHFPLKTTQGTQSPLGSFIGTRATQGHPGPCMTTQGLLESPVQGHKTWNAGGEQFSELCHPEWQAGGSGG